MTPVFRWGEDPTNLPTVIYGQIFIPSIIYIVAPWNFQLLVQVLLSPGSRPNGGKTERENPKSKRSFLETWNWWSLWNYLERQVSIFLGNFTPKTATIALQNRTLLVPGILKYGKFFLNMIFTFCGCIFVYFTSLDVYVTEYDRHIDFGRLEYLSMVQVYVS